MRGPGNPGGGIHRRICCRLRQGAAVTASDKSVFLTSGSKRYSTFNFIATGCGGDGERHLRRHGARGAAAVRRGGRRRRGAAGHGSQIRGTPQPKCMPAVTFPPSHHKRDAITTGRQRVWSARAHGCHAFDGTSCWQTEKVEWMSASCDRSPCIICNSAAGAGPGVGDRQVPHRDVPGRDDPLPTGAAPWHST